MDATRHPRTVDMRRRSRWTAATSTTALIFLLLPGHAAAQGTASWNTTSGNWSNASNWDCAGTGVPSHCVPGSGFTVTNNGGAITLDVDATIARLLGSSGALTLSGRTLTATDPTGIQMTNGLFTASGSSVNGFLLANNLQLDTSTVNGNAQAFTARIANSTLTSLSIANDVTLANSSVGANSFLTLSSGPSSISSSAIGGQLTILLGGSLTVDNGSTVSSTQTLVNAGSLSIRGGSTFTASAAPVFLGLSPGGAAVDVSGFGSVLNLTSTALELGQISDSTVTVEHGGSIAATGAGGNFLIGLGVVFPTNSRMTVNSGGTASANNITVSGGTPGSTGLLFLSDASSSVTAAGQLLVASGGVVHAANHGSLKVGSVRVQSGSVALDSNATLEVTSASAVLIGSAGTGAITFQGGATGSASGELVLGTSAGSNGTMTIADASSKWNGSGNVSVGEGGTGSLGVRSGGVLVTGSDAAGLSGSIGTQRTGNGVVTVQGGDWTAHGTLQVGAAGTGTLQLLQAGTVESGAAVLGASAGSTGSASVSGAGSIWSLAGDLTVGSNGTGSLAILGAGKVANANAVIGDKAASNGSVTVAGLGSSWQNSGILTVGNSGGAGLTIDTGTVTAGGAAIGSNLAPVDVTLSNHGTLNVLGDVSIGGAGATTITVQSGGTFISGVNATIGGAGGDAVVTVSGTDSSWTLHGAGNLAIGDKGSLLVIDGGTVTSTSITVGTNGLLNAQGGRIVGSVLNSGGTVTPGDATGVMTVNGNYVQKSGVLLFEIDGLAPAQFDRMLISGLAELTGGAIEIVFGGGFVPAAGESFDVLSASLGLSLTNVDFTVIGLPAGVGFTQTVGANGLQVAFTPAAAVPEPGITTLLGVGLGVLAIVPGRRRAIRRSTRRLAPTPGPRMKARGQRSARAASFIG